MCNYEQYLINVLLKKIEILLLKVTSTPKNLNPIILFLFLQAYIKIYQGEELPEPKSMLLVSISLLILF